MAGTRKIACVGFLCVACGCCEKHCPKGAIHVHGGVIACVEETKCVGCGKCAKVCPADVITVTEREAAK